MQNWVITTRLAVALLASSAPCSTAVAQERAELTQPPNGDNQRAEVSQWIGLVKVSIAYHSPRVHFRGRERTGHIWGELIPYGLFDEGFGPSTATPWRAGANETTLITLSHDVKIEGRDLKAGTYGLFLELAKSGPWFWIFSTNPGWGSFQYDAKDNALRVAVNPQDAPFAEFLTYGFDDRLPSSAVAYLQWENKRVPFRIDVRRTRARVHGDGRPQSCHRELGVRARARAAGSGRRASHVRACAGGAQERAVMLLRCRQRNRRRRSACTAYAIR